MELTDLQPEVQVKLVEFAYQAAVKLNGARPSAEAYGKTFSDLLDQFARACDSAGKEKKQ
jgi:hypothetical protein